MINERIKLIIESRFKGNTSAFSRKIGISQSTIKDIVGTKATKPSYETLQAILSDETLCVSAEWLLMGKGNMEVSGETSSDIEKLTQVIADLSASNKELVTMARELVRTNSQLANQKKGTSVQNGASCADVG